MVAQESRSGDVLMVAYANREALERTAATGRRTTTAGPAPRCGGRARRPATFSGCVEIRLDCDGDTVLYRVEQTGPACHTGDRTCFPTCVGRGPAGSGAGGGPRRPPADPAGGHDRAPGATERPDGSYTVQLLDRGVAKISQKVGEEAVEVVVAANARGARALASEAADLLYHLLVLLQARGVPLDAVLEASWSTGSR